MTYQASANRTMAVPRFYVAPDAATLAPGARVELPEASAHHAIRVLRLTAGDAATMFDGQGGEYPGVISVVGRKVEIKLGSFDPAERESPFVAELFQGISAGDKMEFTVQKAVELGVAAIHPILAERSVVKLAGERADKRVLHWQQIAIAACEQCGRNRVPNIAAIETLTQSLAACMADKDAKSIRLLLSPRAERALRDLPRPDGRVQLLIGPEGGFSENEELTAKAAGFVAVNLGRRVLRTETAALGALAAMSALWE